MEIMKENWLLTGNTRSLDVLSLKEKSESGVAEVQKGEGG